MPEKTSCASSTTTRSNGSTAFSTDAPFEAAGELAVREEHARAGERLRVETALARLDAEERVQLGLPLARAATWARSSRTRRMPSASSCEMISPASIVLPSPTSSARMQPPSGMRRSAKTTASIWWGFGSMRPWRWHAA